MKKLLFWALILGIASFALLTEHPMLTLLDFVIGGVVPGLNISLGFLPSLAVVLLLFWLLARWVKHLHHQMMSHATNLNKVEIEKKDFTERNAGEIVKNTSVIAAPEAKIGKA